jgi:putative FmdB family regulatory protein
MIYEYRCEMCGESIEITASIAEKEKGLETVCPKCGSKKMKQVLGGFSIGRKPDGGGGSGSGCGPGCSCC